MTANHSTTTEDPNPPTIRDAGPYSTRNTAKGALIAEVGHVFAAIRGGTTIEQVREDVLGGVLVPQRSRNSRKGIWDRIHYRYLTHHIGWIISSFTEALDVGPHSQEFISMAYLHYALRDRLTFDFATEALWHKGYQTRPFVSRNDVLDLLDQKAPEHPEIQKWAETTRVKLAGNILTALRDFGVLEGTQKKYLVRPALPSSIAEHVLRILTVEGCRGREVIESPTWRLFMLTEQDVAATLAKLSRDGKIHFEKVGMTVVLQTPPQWEEER